MAQDKITEVFDIPQIEKNAQDALSAVKAVLPELQKASETLKSSTSIGGSSQATQAANAAMQDFTKNLKDYTEAVKAAANARVKAAQGYDLEATKQKVNATALNAQLKEEVKLTSNLTGAYEKLNVQHKQAIKAYQDAAAAQKLSQAEMTKLKDRANELGQQLVKIDSAVGNYRRNVGNYSSAWNGLGNSINQVARELPNFAQSMQLGFLAISNNLPILADEIGNAKREIAALKAEGKDAPSLFSRIASSIFSWQTALTIGITLLVKYGAEMADWVMQVSSAEKAIREYRKALEDSLKSESDGISKLYILKAALADTTNARSGDLAAFNAVKKEYPQYFDYLNTEKASLAEINAIIDNQIKARIENAKQIALNKVAADATNEYVKAQMGLNKEITAWDKIVSTGSKNTSDFTENTKRSAEAYKLLYKEGKITNNELLVYLDRLNAISKAENLMVIATDNATKSILSLKDAVNSMSEDELIGLENNVIKYKENTKERLNAEEIFVKQKRDIKIKELQQEFNGDAILLAGNKRYQEEKLNIELKAQREIEALRNRYDKKNRPKKEKDISQEVSPDVYKSIIDQLNDFETQVGSIRDRDLREQLDRLATSEISVAEYERRKKEIILKSEDETLREQIKYLKYRLEAIGLNAENTQKVIEKYTELYNQEIKKRYSAEEVAVLQSAKELEQHRKRFDDINQKNQDEADAKRRQKEREQARYMRAIAQETAQFVMQLLDAQAEKEISTLEKRSEALTEKYTLEKSAIDQAAISDEEKTARKLVLDAEEAESQKKIDDQIKAIRRKQAIYEKAQALATIAINTAIALSNPANLASFGAISPFIIALGAVQAAAVLATPLPEYATGKESSDSYEGLAIAGEKGTEMMIDKDGKIQMLTEPTLIHTRRGDTILSNDQLKRGAAEKYVGSEVNYDRLIQAYSYNTERTIKAIKQQPANVIIDNSPFYLNIKRARR